MISFRPVAFSNPNASQIPAIKSQGGHPVEDAKLSQDLAATWLKMEEMVQKGKVRNIGVSNFNIRRTEELLKASTASNPVVNQVEVNWGVVNEELLHYSEAHQIMLQGYSPLGGDHLAQQYLEEPVVVDVARRNNISPAQVLIAWQLARGIIPIVKSLEVRHMEENLAAVDVQLPWDDVVHLTAEANARPIERTMDPSEAWTTQEDIFEDYHDATRLNSLTSDSFEAPPPHEAEGSHYLEPRNDPAAPQVGPGGTAVRSMHTSAAASSSSSSTSRPTVLQQLVGGRGNMRNARHFSSSARSGAVAETAPPSSEEAPAVSSSPLLRTNAKMAARTPGITWTDGEQGIEREARKMNMYTVRPLPSLCSVRGGRRAFSTGAAAAAVSAAASSSSSPSPSGTFSPKAASSRPGRVYTPRKAFLLGEYARLLSQSKLVVLLQHNNLSVSDMSKVRRDIAAVALPEGVQGGEEAKAKLTVVRTGLLKPVVRSSSQASVQSLEGALSGPIALLTCSHLSPAYLGSVLSVLDRALGAGRATPKPTTSSAHPPVTAGVNTRLTPLAALVEADDIGRLKLLDLPALRDVGLLPGLEELRAQVVGLLSAPAAKLASTLDQASGKAVLQTLDARRRELSSSS